MCLHLSGATRPAPLEHRLAPSLYFASQAVVEVPMRAIILSVGDELVLGQTVDTNSAWISQQLAAVGVPVSAHLTVPDDQRAIEQAMLESVGRCDFLIVSGGIGPTEDDLTRQALAAVMGQPLEVNAAWLKELEQFFARR